MIDINIFEKNEIVIVELNGELNVKTSGDFEKHFGELDGKKIILNVEKLDYISSAGLRSLVILVKKLYSSKGELVLCSLGGVVREIVEVSGFENLFKVFETKGDAENYFTKQSFTAEGLK